jgi:hypothetical protein
MIIIPLFSFLIILKNKVFVILDKQKKEGKAIPVTDHGGP